MSTGNARSAHLRALLCVRIDKAGVIFYRGSMRWFFIAALAPMSDNSNPTNARFIGGPLRFAVHSNRHPEHQLQNEA